MNLTYNNSTSEDDLQVIGGLVYFFTHISDYLPYVILNTAGTIFGILGNSIIIATILINKELHSPTYILMFNLSLADITVSSVVNSFTVVGVFVGEPYFDRRPAACQVIGAICLIACVTSLLSIGLLALNRFFHICYSSVYKRIFRRRATYLYCVIAWILGVLVDLPNLVGWNTHWYDTKLLSCIWNRLGSRSYAMFFIYTCIMTPCAAIFFFYMRIFLFAWRSKGRAANNSSVRKSLHIAKGLFASFMLFALCWVPYGFIVLIDYQDRLPRSTVMFTMTIAHLNSTLNPLLYAIFNPSFRNGYINLFKAIIGSPKHTMSNASLEQSLKITVTGTGN